MSQKLSEKLKEAQRWAFENLRGKKVYCPSIGKYVYFNTLGLKHGIKYKTSPVKISMTYHLLKIVKKAKLYDVTTETKTKKNVEKVYRLYTEYKYESKEYFVYIIVFKMKNGHIHYDHGVIKEKEL